MTFLFVICHCHRCHLAGTKLADCRRHSFSFTPSHPPAIASCLSPCLHAGGFGKRHHWEPPFWFPLRYPKSPCADTQLWNVHPICRAGVQRDTTAQQEGRCFRKSQRLFGSHNDWRGYCHLGGRSQGCQTS